MSPGKDIVVFDIETSNFFTSPEVGWGNFEAINISVVGVYSYQKQEYACFEAHQKEELRAWFSNAETIVGFASNRYDTPVLNLYFRKQGEEAGGPLDLWRKRRVDLLEEIELATGSRVSLSRLAQANLGVGKDTNGSEAITMFAEGRMEELKEYCLKDVRLTKELYDLFIEKKQLILPGRENEQSRVITFHEPPLQVPLF